jgi:putative spermidine/putrescine transport system substrate-binding protein
MVDEPLSRRALLGIAWGGSLLFLRGCGPVKGKLAARRGEMPDRWVRVLPNDWRVNWLEGSAGLQKAVWAPMGQRPALVQLTDGWASTLSPRAWEPFGHEDILARLSPRAALASRLFRGLEQAPLGFPWSFNPWVILLRDRPDLARREERGWDLLLDPSLTGKVVLPASPRVVMALVGHDPERLCQLRRQALSLDDRDGLNLLLSGGGEAAVLPRQRVVPLLRRDPRLTALLPHQGGPVAWSLLLRPAGAHPIPPGQWLEACLTPPLLPRLLAGGWVPPLPRPALEEALRGMPPPLQSLLLPPEGVLNRCVSFPPLSEPDRQQLQELWNRSLSCPQP